MAAIDPKSPCKMDYNRVRFDAYKRCAKEFVDGETYDANELANMLHDLRWAEVPRAFSVALYNAARKGPLRPGLGDEFKKLIDYVTFLAFGSIERDVVQPWYLKNWDDFFVACTDGILSLNSRADIEELKRREPVIRRAFEGVLQLIGGARAYMSLSRLAHSDPVHALLVAAGHSPTPFLVHGHLQMGGDADEIAPSCLALAKRKMTLAHVFLMEVVAEAILATHDDVVVSWKRAFGHYAGANRWRTFAQNCNRYAAKRGIKPLKAVVLEAQVEQSYQKARNNLVAALATLERERAGLGTEHTPTTTKASQKRKRMEEYEEYQLLKKKIFARDNVSRTPSPVFNDPDNLYALLDASPPAAALCH